MWVKKKIVTNHDNDSNGSNKSTWNKIKKIDFKKKEQIQICENFDKVKVALKKYGEFRFIHLAKRWKKIDLHENMNSKWKEKMGPLQFLLTILVKIHWLNFMSILFYIVTLLITFSFQKMDKKSQSNVKLELLQ